MTVALRQCPRHGAEARAIRVLHLITGLGVGGAEAMLAKLVIRMDRSSFDNHVVSMLVPGPLADPIRAAGVSVNSLNMRRGLPSPAALWRLRQLLRRERPDLVQTWLYHADLLGTIGAGVAGVSHIAWNLRCSFMDMNHYSLLSRGVRALLARLSPLPDAVVANSEAGRRAHADLGYRPRRWVVIPNGFDTERFTPIPAGRARVRAKLGLAADELAIGMPARFDPMKDHGNFLAAAVRVAGCFPEARFLLIGRGLEPSNPGLRPLLERARLGDRVLLLGERRDMPELLAALDIAVLSSAFGEGLPNVLGEAMACGTPCVTTRVGDAATLVADTGWAVPARAPEELARALIEVCSLATQERAALGRRARDRIVTHYSLDLIASRYAELYGSLIDVRVATG